MNLEKVYTICHTHIYVLMHANPEHLQFFYIAIKGKVGILEVHFIFGTETVDFCY